MFVMEKKESKNEILEGKEKKIDPVYMPELHSCPELMSYSEKLELAEEILCISLAPILAREQLDARVEDVQDTVLLIRYYPEIAENVEKEISRFVEKLTEGRFSAKAIR